MFSKKKGRSDDVHCSEPGCTSEGHTVRCSIVCQTGIKMSETPSLPTIEVTDSSSKGKYNTTCRTRDTMVVMTMSVGQSKQRKAKVGTRKLIAQVTDHVANMNTNRVSSLIDIGHTSMYCSFSRAPPGVYLINGPRACFTPSLFRKCHAVHQKLTPWDNP